MRRDVLAPHRARGRVAPEPRHHLCLVPRRRSQRALVLHHDAQALSRSLLVLPEPARLRQRLAQPGLQLPPPAAPFPPLRAQRLPQFR